MDVCVLREVWSNTSITNVSVITNSFVHCHKSLQIYVSEKYFELLALSKVRLNLLDEGKLSQLRKHLIIFFWTVQLSLSQKEFFSIVGTIPTKRLMIFKICELLRIHKALDTSFLRTFFRFIIVIFN